MADLEDMVAAFGDDRFRVVPALERRGAAHARNVGAEAAHGSVLAFCDGDDVADPGWLEALVRGLDEHDAVGGQLIDLPAEEDKESLRPPATPGGLPTFLGVPYIVSASLALPRDRFRAVGGFDEDLVRCEDIALSWSLISDGGELGFVPDARVAYRSRSGLPALLHQHYLYGQGMAEVLVRYGVPDGPDWERPSGLGLLRPNGQPGGRGSWIGVLRRGALAAGRVVGLAKERIRAWRRR